MYINFCCPVCTAEELISEESLQVQLLGLKFVAFRDSEGWRANKIVILNVNCYYERSVENGLDPVLENTVLAKDRNVTGELRAGRLTE